MKKLKQNIIAGIVIIVLVAGFALFNILSQKEPVEFFKVVGTKKHDNVLIEEFRIMKKISKDSELKADMSSSTTYEKRNVLEYFNEEYFTNKKVALVVLYEDTTKGYIQSIDDVIYNEAKTEATIKYTSKADGYEGTFGSAWYNYLFVELEGTVENVKFVLDNNSAEEK